MKMKKYLSIAILLMLMATPLVFTSCGGDDLVDGIENQKPTAEIWIEPYHIKGASVEDVKSYMASRINHFTMSEQVSAGCVQLVYSDKRTGAGIVYSFSLDRALYSVIDTEPISKMDAILRSLQQSYELVSEQSGVYLFSTTDKSTAISIMPVNKDFVYVNYDFISCLLYTSDAADEL